MAFLRTAASALLAASAVSATGIILPLYVYPSATYGDGAANWEPAFDAIAASPNTQWLVVVNPASGPGATLAPGNDDANYITGVTKLNAQTNVQTVGYVRTNYGKSSTDELQANITAWAGWSSSTDDIGVTGIFFDESSADAFDYLSSAITFARNAFASQQITTICNFGVAVDASLYDICDVVVAFESALNSATDSSLPPYEDTTTIEANIPDASYRPRAAVIVNEFVGTATDGSEADTTLLRTYVQDAQSEDLGWLFFCSGGYDSLTTDPITIGALAAAF
ncbi:Spherulation-specific family 4-domain-containing protein [Xylaria arbuscula]|nr:Spherulation-specific family 4-domain-containing protein [Xylaria arbuscula]